MCFYKIGTLICFCIAVSTVKAQKVVVDSLHTLFVTESVTLNGIAQRDVIDYTRKWLKIKTNASHNGDSNSNRVIVSVMPAVGYTLQSRFAGLISGNLAFYANPKHKTRLSVINSSVGYTENKQFFIPIQSSIWLWNDKVNLLGDLRFMKYPQSTFGLGTNAPLSHENPMQYHYFRWYQYLLFRVMKNVYIGPGIQLDYRWNISETGLPNGQISDYNRYGAAAQTLSDGAALNFLYDNRTNPINARKGFMANVIYRKNPDFWNTHAWSSLVVDVRKYIPLSNDRKHVLALWNYAWVILDGKAPYLDLPATGWDNLNSTGRGYIQGRFRGNHFYYAEAEYRMNLTKNGLFGGVVFTNAQMVTGWASNALPPIQPAAGVGIRIKLNKKSDTNIAIDYGFGSQGSRGLFVNIGELF